MQVHDVLGSSTNGWNKFITQGKTLSPDGATNTGSLPFNLQISNGSDCTRGLVQTHATSDAYMTIKKTVSSKGVVTWNV
ncbi:hypothetical protein, partial [Klebsiella aerogenes]|uniref:hypothetical protein n=1 Tax=Klebsiella aerogenes TaxID=548 RepID=UPI001CC362CD